MADLIKLALEEAGGSTTFANTGTAGGTWTASTEAPTAGATGVIGNCITTAYTGNKEYVAGGGGSTSYEPTANSFTIYAWCKPIVTAHGTSERKRVVSKFYRAAGTWTSPYTSIELFIDTQSNQVTYYAGFAITVSGTRYEYSGYPYIFSNAWNMLAMTYDGATVKIYANGVLLAPITLAGSCDFGTHGQWVVAGNTELAADNFEGSVDEVTAQTGVLTRDQLVSLYNAHGNLEVVTSYNTALEGVTSARKAAQPSFWTGTPLLDLTWTAQKSSSAVLISFNRILRDLAATTIASNYTVTGPSTITVNSVTFTPGNAYLYLNVTGSFVPGTYTVNMATNTAQASADDIYNSTTPYTFDGGTVVVAGGSNWLAGFN